MIRGIRPYTYKNFQWRKKILFSVSQLVGHDLKLSSKIFLIGHNS